MNLRRMNYVAVVDRFETKLPAVVVAVEAADDVVGLWGPDETEDHC